MVRRDYGRLAKEAFTSNPNVSLKQKLNSSKINKTSTICKYLNINMNKEECLI